MQFLLSSTYNNTSINLSTPFLFMHFSFRLSLRIPFFTLHPPPLSFLTRCRVHGWSSFLNKDSERLRTNAHFVVRWVHGFTNRGGSRRVTTQASRCEWVACVCAPAAAVTPPTTVCVCVSHPSVSPLARSLICCDLQCTQKRIFSVACVNFNRRHVFSTSRGPAATAAPPAAGECACVYQ